MNIVIIFGAVALIAIVSELILNRQGKKGWKSYNKITRGIDNIATVKDLTKAVNETNQNVKMIASALLTLDNSQVQKLVSGSKQLLSRSEDQFLIGLMNSYSYVSYPVFMGKQIHTTRIQNEVDRFISMGDFEGYHKFIGMEKTKSPNQPFLYLLDSYAYVKENKIEEARLHSYFARQNMSKEDDEAELLYHESCIEDLAGNPEIAINFVKRALQVNPEHYKSIQLYGYYLWRYDKDYGKAINMQHEALEAGGSKSIYFNCRAYNNLAYYHIALSESKITADRMKIVTSASNYLDKAKEFEEWNKMTAVVDTSCHVAHRKYLAKLIGKDELNKAYHETVNSVEDKSDKDNPILQKHLDEMREELKGFGSENE